MNISIIWRDGVHEAAIPDFLHAVGIGILAFGMKLQEDMPILSLRELNNDEEAIT